MKINKTAIRRITAQKVADSFITSGKPFECPASLLSSERKYALTLAQELLDAGINLSKGSYSFSWKGNMADMFLSDAVKIVHEKFFGAHS